MMIRERQMAAVSMAVTKALHAVWPGVANGRKFFGLNRKKRDNEDRKAA